MAPLLPLGNALLPVQGPPPGQHRGVFVAKEMRMVCGEWPPRCPQKAMKGLLRGSVCLAGSPAPLPPGLLCVKQVGTTSSLCALGQCQPEAPSFSSAAGALPGLAEERTAPSFSSAPTAHGPTSDGEKGTQASTSGTASHSPPCPPQAKALLPSPQREYVKSCSVSSCGGGVGWKLHINEAPAYCSIWRL